MTNISNDTPETITPYVPNSEALKDPAVRLGVVGCLHLLVERVVNTEHLGNGRIESWANHHPQAEEETMQALELSGELLELMRNTVVRFCAEIESGQLTGPELLEAAADRV